MSLELTALSVRLRDAAEPLFAPLTLCVPSGEVTTVMGASGVGKSMLLAMIGGHLPHSFVGAGRIVLNGRDVIPTVASADSFVILEGFETVIPCCRRRFGDGSSGEDTDGPLGG